VACAAALALIEVLESENLLENARRLGDYALERMHAMKVRHPLIGDVRGLGLLMGIELLKDRATRERATPEAEQVMYAALAKGLSFKVTMGNILTLTPPLTITQPQLDTAFDILEDCLREIEQT